MKQGRHRIDDTLNQKTETHIISTVANFGISNKFSLSFAVPLIINRSVNTSLDKTATNIGDISVQFRHFSSPRVFSKRSNIQVSIGTSVPVGNGLANVITDEKNFATGTLDPIVNIIAALLIKPGWSVDGRFYTRQVLSFDKSRNKIGDLYSYGFNVTYAPVGSPYNINAQIKFINRSQDIFNDNIFENSGGDFIYLSPGFSRKVFGKGESAVSFWSEFDVPLYQYVQGTQLTEKWNVRFGLNFGLTILGHSKKPNNGSPIGSPIGIPIGKE